MLPYVKIYRDFIDVARELADDERGRLFLAVMQYANGEEVTPLKGAEKIAFVVLRSQIDRDNAAHDEYIEKQRENGKLGGRPKKDKPNKKKPQDPSLTPQNPENPSLTPQNPENLDIDIDIDIDTDVDNYKHPSDLRPQDVCPELSSSSAPKPAPVIEMPLNDGTFFPISQEQCHEWAGLYPAVDVIQQLRNMRGWLDSNTRNRKTKNGILRFVTGWLSREQNRAGVAQRQRPQQSPRVSMGPSPAHQMSPVGADDVERMFRELGRSMPAPPAEDVG